MTQHVLKTTDFHLAAFCICNGAVIRSIDRTQNRAVFELAVQESPKDVVESFWAGATVPANKFVTALGEVKKRLYSDSING